MVSDPARATPSVLLACGLQEWLGYVWTTTAPATTLELAL
jgi:predicted DNA-binding transcriptional regulator